MGAKLTLGLFAVGCGLWTATEVFAYLAWLDPALGTPLWRELFVAIYWPWDILRWAWWWGRTVPEAFLWPSGAGLGGAGVVLLAGWPATSPHQEDARWASRREWRKAECCGKQGIVLGEWH